MTTTARCWLQCICPAGASADGITRLLRFAAVGLRLAVSFLSPCVAFADDGPGITRRLTQSAEVMARYPNLPITLDTPALAPGRTTFTSQAEMEAYIAALAAAPAAAAHLTRLTLGTTPRGRDLPALLLSREGARTPAELAKLARPIVWLIGQQHGNEPAGGEAMLALARALADGELTPLLDMLSVVIIPRANPDGASNDTRENSAGFDINRDHGLLSQPEIKMMHKLVRQLPPALVVDAHEFTVGRRWLEKLGGLQSVDLMLLSSTHPMTPAPLRALADRVFQPAIEAAVARYGLTSFVYHTISAREGDRTISVGGAAPGIARNAFGLMGAVSFLLETRGVGIGRDGYQRRVATHYVAIKGILEAAARHRDALIATVAAVRASVSSPAEPVVIGHSVARTLALLPLVDPISGLDKVAAISLLDTRVVTGTEQRPRPAGYIIEAERVAAVREQLALLGGQLCTLATPAVLAIERFEVLNHPPSDRRSINPVGSLSVRVIADRRTVPAGSVYVPLDSPAAPRLELALEPDTPGSLSAQALAGASNRMAIMRVPQPPAAADIDCGG